MNFVDFHISTILRVDSTQSDNVVEVTVYMYRGHYGDVEQPDPNDRGKKITVNTYIRDEKFGEALIIFVPQNATELEINKALYDLLMGQKEPNDEVIPECVF